MGGASARDDPSQAGPAPCGGCSSERQKVLGGRGAGLGDYIGNGSLIDMGRKGGTGALRDGDIGQKGVDYVRRSGHLGDGDGLGASHKRPQI